MAFAAILPLEAAAAQRVRAVWQSLASHGDAIAALGVVPHITLASWDEIDPDRLRSAVADLAASQKPVTVSLSALGASANAVFLVPAQSPGLQHWHAALLAGLPPPDPHYQPGSWLAHVTLAKAIPDRAGLQAAFRIAADLLAGLPIVTELRSVQAISFRPVRVLNDQWMVG